MDPPYTNNYSSNDALKGSPRLSTSQTQVAFVRLDPILKPLLQAVTDYKETATASNGSNNKERIIAVIQRQIDLLKQLQQAAGTTLCTQFDRLG